MSEQQRFLSEEISLKLAAHLQTYLLSLLTCLLLLGRGAVYCDQPICLSVCVCLCVCVSIRGHISGTAGPIFMKFCMQIPLAVARSSSGGVAIRYVLPLLWLTSRLAVVGRITMRGLGVAKYSTPRGVARPGRSLMSMNTCLIMCCFCCCCRWGVHGTSDRVGTIQTLTEKSQDTLRWMKVLISDPLSFFACLQLPLRD